MTCTNPDHARFTGVLFAKNGCLACHCEDLVEKQTKTLVSLRQTDLETCATERDRLLAAIRRHRDIRGDDRCYQDDSELYAALPEGDTRPERETAVTIENCRRYIECRQTGREYISPQRRIEELEERLKTAGSATTHLFKDESGNVIHACMTASFPLPDNHWIYDEPVEPQPGHVSDFMQARIRAALRYTIQVCTRRGKDMDFDPDAMCLTLIHSLGGDAAT